MPLPVPAWMPSTLGARGFVLFFFNPTSSFRALMSLIFQISPPHDCFTFIGSQYSPSTLRFVFFRKATSPTSLTLCSLFSRGVADKSNRQRKVMQFIDDLIRYIMISANIGSSLSRYPFTLWFPHINFMISYHHNRKSNTKQQALGFLTKKMSLPHKT